MGMWDHIPPRKLTENFGLAGGWLMPPAPQSERPLTCPLCDGHGWLASPRKDRDD